MSNNYKSHLTDYLTISLYFIISLGCLSSQTNNISGIILDSQNKKPISDVNIFIDNSHFGTTTDSEGYFSLMLNELVGDSSELNIKMIGYENLVIPLAESKAEICRGCLSYQIILGEILITAKSIEFESINVHAHQHILNQISDISLSGQKLNDNLNGNIATTLSNQPNIGISSFGTVTSKPVLRGFSGDRFLITKDGNIMGDLSQTSLDHVITLEMTEIKEIEIIRGPKALVYGSNAIGGVINTSISIDPKVKFDDPYTKINLGGESFNKGIYGNLLLYIPFKNNQLNLSFNNRNTQNQTSPIGELENTQSKTANYKLGYTKYNKNSFINLLFENYNIDYGIPASEEGHINGVDIELTKNTFQLNLHNDISLYNFNQFDVKYNFIDYIHKEFESNSEYRAVALAKNTHNTRIEIKSSQTIIGSEINFKQFSAQGFYWTPKTDEIDMAFYGYNEKQLNDFDLLSSFRMGYLLIQPQKTNIFFSNLDINQVINRNFTFFSSSIGLKWNFENFEFSSWLMNTMRAPKLEELYSDGPHLGTYSYEIGTPNLDLEKVYGNESSIRYNTLPLKISLTTFYNYSPYYYQMSKIGVCDGEFLNGIDHPCAGADFIEWGSGSSGWLYKYQTEGIESLIKGIEFNLIYNYQRFKVSYDFSLVRGENLTNGLPLSYINPDKQILILKYQKELTNYKLRLSKVHSQNRLGEFESYTPSSFLIDFIISYSNKNQNITIQFNNILNEEYYNHLSKLKSITPEAGSNIVLNYKIFF